MLASPRVRPLLAAVVAFAVIVTLSGCISSGTSKPLPTIEVDTPAVPASLHQAQPIVYVDGQILPASGTAPFAIGGSQQLPGKAPAAVVWTSSDGGAWKAHPVDAGLNGAFHGGLHGDASLSAVGGTVWQHGSISTALWTSTDRQTWKRTTLPGTFAARYRLSELSVSHGRVALIGADTNGVLAAELITAGKVTDMKLPTPPKGKVLITSSLTWGAHDDLVLLARSTTEGDDAPVDAYLSHNAGSTWSKPAAVAEKTDFVSGATWTGSAWVATGGRYASTDPGAPYRPVAWSSPDGTTWTAESVPNPSSRETGFDANDASLASPEAGSAGDVAAIGRNDSSALAAVFHRAPNGTWQYVTDTSVNDGNGASGLAVPLADGRILAAMGTQGGVRIGYASGGWADGTHLSTLAPSNEVTLAQSTPDGVKLTMSRASFTVRPNLGWNNSSVVTQAAVSTASKVTDAPWDPPDAAALSNTIGGSSGDKQVVLGSDYSSGDVSLVNGWFRAKSDDQWTKATGFSTMGATEFASVKRIGDQWIAVGTVRINSNVATPTHATVWTSPDGVAWSPASGDFGSGPLASAAVDVCTIGKTPIAVGWTETSTGRYALTGWQPKAAGWSTVDFGAFDNGHGYGTGCTDAAGGVLVSAQLAGRSVLLLDGKQGWQRVFRAGRGDSLSTPLAVPGGYAAAGAFSDRTHSQAVVWLSFDAKHWAPVAVPSYQDGAASQVALLGKDLVVTMSPETGPAVSIVRDVKAAIGRYAR